jgi:hypothetical protein
MKLMACSLVLGASMVALAQQPAAGVIVGTVRDGSGAVLPGVTLSARSATEGTIVATTVAGAAGSYTLRSRRAGTSFARVCQGLATP